MSTLAGTLRSWAVRDMIVSRRGQAGFGVATFTLAAALGGQVAVALPFTPVPLTLQPLFVVLAGVLLGPRFGAISMAAYVAVGALGAPVFSNGAAGLPWLLGPTGGYLLAAPAAAYVAGLVAGRHRGLLRTFCGLTLGVLTMYVGGVSWLLAATGASAGVAVAWGVVPFLAADAVKIVIALGVVRALRCTSLNRP